MGETGGGEARGGVTDFLLALSRAQPGSSSCSSSFLLSSLRQVDAAEKVLSAYYAKKEAKVRCQAIPTVTLVKRGSTFSLR